MDGKNGREERETAPTHSPSKPQAICKMIRAQNIVYFVAC